MLERFARFTEQIGKVIQQRSPCPFDLNTRIKQHIQQRLATKRIIKLLSYASAAIFLISLGLVSLLWQKSFREILISWDAFSEQATVLEDGTTLRTTPKTRYQVIGYRNVVLRQGELWLNVVKSDRIPFRVDTPFGRVIVKGTEFVVQVLRKEEKMRLLKGTVAVLVIAGMVELVNPFGTEVIGPGEYGYAQEGSKPKKKLTEQKPTKEAKLIIWEGKKIGIYDIQKDEWKVIKSRIEDVRPNLQSAVL
jgi:ferric-dicitrate binding protein FerR (iron transport regulator)